MNLNDILTAIENHGVTVFWIGVFILLVIEKIGRAFRNAHRDKEDDEDDL